MKLIKGNCLEVIKEMPENSVDTIITDPPYGLSKHSQEEVLACLSAWIKGEPYCPKVSGGFMNKTWDSWVPGPEIWKECLRVLKPGGMCLVFAGTRSLDLMGMALRIAGFELRDSIGYLHEDAGKAPLLAWVHGQGFPKSTDISKQIDRQAGAEREVIGINKIHGGGNPKSNSMSGKLGRESELPLTAPATEEAKKWEGYKTALKPAFEPILLAMKPVEGTFAENAVKYGVAGLNIEECRLEYSETNSPIPQLAQGKTEIKTENGMYGGNSYIESKTKATIGGSLAGRFPANIIHDGSEEVLSLFPEGSSKAGKKRVANINNQTRLNNSKQTQVNCEYTDSGSAARFFYCAKASSSERNKGCEQLPEVKRPIAGNNQGVRVCITCGKTDNSINDHSNCEGNFEYRQCKPLKNNHPTVKPLSLMEYLCRLTKTPTGGIVLDPFMGSGTTGIACKLTGRGFIGIEQDEYFFEIAKTRIENFTPEEIQKKSKPVKKKEEIDVAVKQPSLLDLE